MKKLSVCLFVLFLLFSMTANNAAVTSHTGKQLVIRGKLKQDLKQIGQWVRVQKKLTSAAIQKWKILIQDIHRSGESYKIDKLIEVVMKDFGK